MNWRPAPSSGAWLGLAAAAAALTVETAIIAFGRRAFPGPSAAIAGLLAWLLAPSILWLSYWVWGRLSLSYDLTRDGIVIRWAAHRQVIPMEAITHVLIGRPYEAPLTGFRWPGHEVGRTRVSIDDDGDTRDTMVFATVPPSGQLIVATSDIAYAISPADRAGFIDEFRVRSHLGAVQALEHRTTVVSWLVPSIWRDGLILGFVALGFMLNAVAFAWLTWRYPTLPADVAFGYAIDAGTGEVIASELQPLRTVWWVPSIAFVALLANVILAAIVNRRARLASRVLVFGALMLQIVVLVSLIKLQ